MSSKEIALIGSGIMGCCLAFQFTKTGQKFKWYLGRSKSASLSAGAMVTTVSEWDFNVAKDAEVASAAIRIEGSKLLREMLTALKIESDELPLTVLDNGEGDLEKICAIASDYKLDVKIGKSESLIDFGERCVDARRLLAATKLYVKEIGFAEIVEKDALKITVLPDEVCVESELALDDYFDRVILSVGFAPNLYDELFGKIDEFSLFGLDGCAFIAAASSSSNQRFLNSAFGCGLHKLRLNDSLAYFGSTSSLRVGGHDHELDTVKHNTFLREELARKRFFDVDLKPEAVLVGSRALSSRRKPEILTNRQGSIMAITGLGRTGFSTAPVIAAYIIRDLEEGTSKAFGLFDFETSAHKKFIESMKMYKETSKQAGAAIRMFNKRYPVVELLSWAEALGR